ncbi:MAG: TonB-dependent receptor, partial [Muribaculaceae bacterium]|nr:TonB-dependent receptor [Muribaculaceae bacterium]
PQVNFTANMYVNTPRKTMDMMDGTTYAQFVRDTFGADSQSAACLGVNGTIYNTNWQDEVLRTSISSDYSLSVGGTAGVLPYRVSVSYTNNNGIIKTSKMDRATASINLTPKFFDDLLSVNLNVKGAYIANRYTKDGVLGGAVSFNPTLPVYMPGGNNLNNYTSYGPGGALLSGDTGVNINTIHSLNPASMINDYSSKSKVYQSIGNLQLDLKMPFLRELRANLNLAYDYSHGECTNFDTPFSPAAWKDAHYVEGSDVTVRDGYASRKKENEERYNLLLDFYLNYNKDLTAINSSLDVTAGYSWQKFKFQGHDYTRTYAPGQSFDGYQRTPTVYYSKPYQLLSYFGRVNYSLLDRYLLTVTVRRDGTSRFSKDTRWGTFPSVALGWKLLDESFMEGARGVMNELKLRAGYGVTGQQDLGEDYLYFYMPVFNQSTNMNQQYVGPDGKTYYYTVMPNAYNAALKWEETHTWNAGVDFAMLNNRINGSIDFYKRKTKDLLTTANYPIGSNLSNRGPQNLGDLENIGVEFNLVTRPVVTKEFTWTSSFNIAWNKNKVTRLAEGADTTTG